MNIFMLVNVTALLLFTPKQPTTLSFQNPIEYYSIGNQGSFETYLTKNRRILLIKPQADHYDEFLVVITKEKSYQFRIKESSQKKNALYKIKDGTPEKYYKLRNKGNGFRVLEGRNTLKVIKDSKIPLEINGNLITKREYYYPQNAQLVINGSSY